MTWIIITGQGQNAKTNLLWNKNELYRNIQNYQDYFKNHPHLNFLCPHSPIGPLAVSLIRHDSSFMCIVRSRQGQESLVVDVSRFPKGKSEPSLQQILEQLQCQLPYENLKNVSHPELAQELLDMELSLLKPRHVVNFVTKQQTNRRFFEFFDWIDGSEMDHIEFQVSDPEKMNGEGIVIVFQTIPDTEFLEYVKQYAKRAILIVSAEPELGGYTLQLLLRKEFAFNTTIPSMIPKDIPSRDYLLDTLGFLYIKTRHFGEMKVQRHQALYNVIKKYYK
jgi:hypothetical protein